MKTTFSKSICLLASLLLVLALTLSCSTDDNTGGGGGNDNPFAGNPQYERAKEYYKYYDPDDEYDPQRCRNGIVEEKCEVNGNEVWYNPLTNGCNEVNYTYTCDEKNGCYIAHTCVENGCHDEYELGTLELCGSQFYISSPNGRSRCKSGVLERKCGYGENVPWYNSETHYCKNNFYEKNNSYETYTVVAMERCGSKYYIHGDYSRCQNGVVEKKCGYDENATWYNPDTHYCSYGNSGISTVKPLIRCGNEYINGDDNRCNNGIIESRCGSSKNENATWYNYITQSCDWGNGTVRNKVRCGS